jgi:apolipoprotein D and lipocalin family protein
MREIHGAAADGRVGGPGSLAGKWYEVARLPNSFQRDDSTAVAEYSLNPDGTVGVRNTETRPDGSTKMATGTASAVPGSNQTRLRVKFSGLASLAPSPTEGNYWIIGLAPDYSVAVVGTPGRKYLWILAREAELPATTLDHWKAKAKELGFPVEKLIYRKSQALTAG